MEKSGLVTHGSLAPSRRVEATYQYAALADYHWAAVFDRSVGRGFNGGALPGAAVAGPRGAVRGTVADGVKDPRSYRGPGDDGDHDPHVEGHDGEHEQVRQGRLYEVERRKVDVCESPAKWDFEGRLSPRSRWK